MATASHDEENAQGDDVGAERGERLEDAADDASEDEADVDVPTDTPLSLAFTGTVAEYFRIWVVNTFLTVVTLGVFSAWAKVRKKRYLYSHTVVDGSPFRYLGRPIPILKGRILALALLGGWYFVTRHHRQLLIPLGLIAALVFPWILVRTASFNARSTSYRNITFDFKSDYRRALSITLGGIVLLLLSCGLAYPWLQYRLRHWLITSTHYGRERCRFYATPGTFYRIYFAVWLITAGALVAIAVVAPDVVSRMAYDDLRTLTILSYCTYLLATCVIYTAVTNRVWNLTHLGPLGFKSDLRTVEVAWLYFSNGVLVLGSLGLLAPWATLRIMRYRVRRLSLGTFGSLSELEGLPTLLPSAGGAELADAFDMDLSL